MTVSPLTKALVVIQLVLASYLVILMDEALQRGWGIGSAISLFILAMVAQTVVWDMFGFVPRIALDFGVVPALIYDRNPFIVFTRANGFPDVTGLLATFAIVVLLVYLQAMMVEIPVTSPQLRGIRTKVPLQFLYVTNIPVLLLAILVADLQLFEAPIARFFGLNSLAYRLFEDQVRRVLENLKAILEAAGLTLDDVVKVTAFLKDPSKFQDFNRVYSEYFKGPFPARTTVFVADLPAGAQVEIEAIALRPR